MHTLEILIGFFTVYGMFHMAMDVGKMLKKARRASKAINDSNNIIKEHGKGKRKG